MHLVALSAVVAAAFGLVGLRGMELPGPEPIADGDRLRIEVVQPIEPKLPPGGVMDVGELTDGYVHVPLRPPTPEPALYAYGEGWEEYYEPPAPRRRSFEAPVIAEGPAPRVEAPRRDRADRWFGFDAPRRDYQREREARRARMEALERRERERERELERYYQRDRRGSERDDRREPDSDGYWG